MEKYQIKSIRNYYVSKKTASRELADIVAKKVFKRKGITGKGTFYILLGQRGS